MTTISMRNGLEIEGANEHSLSYTNKCNLEEFALIVGGSICIY